MLRALELRALVERLALRLVAAAVVRLAAVPVRLAAVPVRLAAVPVRLAAVAVRFAAVVVEARLLAALVRRAGALRAGALVVVWVSAAAEVPALAVGVLAGPEGLLLVVAIVSSRSVGSVRISVRMKV